jgi:predicted NBD/HSP70 family sugar kinase
MSPFIVPAWAGYDIRAWLHERYQHPIVIDNDANLGALAEQWWGERADDLTYIKIGMGVGAGHIIRGELYRGAGGSAGEVGHIVLDPAGPPCRCGNRGCLVMFIGSDVLVARARARMQRAADDPLTMAMIIDLAGQGDAIAQEIIADAGHYLGIALASLVNILNPAVVVLGGVLASAGDMLIDPLRTSIRSHALSKSIAETRIVASTLDRRAIAVGAATLVLAAALRDYTLFPLAGDAP